MNCVISIKEFLINHFSLNTVISNHLTFTKWSIEIIPPDHAYLTSQSVENKYASYKQPSHTNFSK